MFTNSFKWDEIVADSDKVQLRRTDQQFIEATKINRVRSNSQADTTCVERRVEVTDNYSFTMRWPQTYGTCFFVSLVSNGPHPISVKDAYESWSQWRVEKAIKKIWNMVPACIFSSIWLERKRGCFDGESTPLGVLKARCISNMFIWSTLHPDINAEHLLDFISSLVLA